MKPLPPGLFSTTTCWPQASVSLAPTMREAMSVMPPGAYGTQMWRGLAGELCACAGAAQKTTSAMTLTIQAMDTSCADASGDITCMRDRLRGKARRRRSPRQRSDLAHDSALVPAPQQQMGDERQREEDHDAGDGEEQQRREHARNVEPVARFDDAIGEARAGAGRAGRDLGDHGADQRQPARDLQATQDI